MGTEMIIGRYTPNMPFSQAITGSATPPITSHNPPIIKVIKIALTAAKAIMSHVQKRVVSGFSFSSIRSRVLQMHKETIRFDLEGSGQRLDAALAGAMPDTSRAQIQAWIKQGLVTDDKGKPLVQGSLKLKQPISVTRYPAAEKTFCPTCTGSAFKGTGYYFRRRSFAGRQQARRPDGASWCRTS
jgi:hypothetical protein